MDHMTSLEPEREGSLKEAPSPLLPKIGDPEMMLEDSLDGGPPSVGSGDIPTPVSMATPISKKKTSGKKLVTGYILYSSDVRRTVAANHPDSSFGEISRIVGNEWRNLPSHEKQSWEEKAAKVNEETAAKQAEEMCPSPAAPSTPNPSPATNTVDIVYECCWDNCDWQFEDISDCTEHCVNETNGHVQQYFASINQASDSEYQCQWRGCMRVKKGSSPFPNLQRLTRHVKELHIQKGNGRHITLHEKSRNYVPARRSAVCSSRPLIAVSQGFQTSNMVGGTGGGACAGTVAPALQRPVEPLFVSVPPRPQRLLHSEAYIRYIEGLQAENKHISPWEKHLKATQENTAIPDISRLPAEWLGNGVGNHGNIVNALWTLRDFMMRDALGINKVL